VLVRTDIHNKWQRLGSTMDKIITPKEVAQFLRLTESTICRLASQGDLPGFKIGNSWRFDREEIMQTISEAKTRAVQGKGDKGSVKMESRNNDRGGGNSGKSEKSRI
jgi:excisionase family DNA binding protein